MPGGYGTYGPWGSSGNTYTTPTVTTSSSHPGQRVWEEDRRDEPTVSVDYTTPTVDTSQPIIDVAAERDAIDDAAAMALSPRDVYTKPEEIYEWLPGGDPSDWINVSNVGGGVYNPESALYGINLEDYGFSNKEEFLPRDFLQSIIEGSIVSGGEYAQTPTLRDEPEPNIGTWGMVEGQWNFGDPGGLLEGAMTPENYAKYKADIAGFEKDPALAHPLFPGGQEDYYNMMNENWGETYDGGEWDSWADPWYGGHYQGYDDSMSDMARHFWFSESLDDVTARKEERRKAGLGPAGMRASEMEQMYDREFAAKANPLFDPGYSQSVTEEMNPIAAGMELFDIARME